jgi:hypothetical protein
MPPDAVDCLAVRMPDLIDLNAVPTSEKSG